MASNYIVINVDPGETRVALIENGICVELYIERTRDRSLVGNIYLGRVSRVIAGMQAAFVDIGLEKAAFLPVSDVIPAEDFDALIPDSDDASEVSPPRRIRSSTPIREVLKEGEKIVVQVAKGPLGTKGARATSHVSLAGRHLVYMPTYEKTGVSRRVTGEEERKRLRDILGRVKPSLGGVIARTAAEGATEDEIRADVAHLVQTWSEILKNHEVQKAPSLLYGEPDLVLRAARDFMNAGISKVIIDDENHFQRLLETVGRYAPDRRNAVELYTGAEPIFDAFGIEEEIKRALGRRVPLPSGGFLVLDQAEALTAIDVNTGRYTGGKDLEETITKTNLEAVKEIAYQLRFRNLGGLIVVDFIDMDRPSNRDKVYRSLRESLKQDRAKTTAMRISELGLVEMTRKRTRESLGRTLHEPCFYCDGTGQILSRTSICYEIFREIRRERHRFSSERRVALAVHPEVAKTLEREERDAFLALAAKLNIEFVVEPRKDFHFEQFELSAARSAGRKEGK